MNNILSSYDDAIAPDLCEYWFERLNKCISGCQELKQLPAIDRAIKLFRRKYPEQHAKAQNLFRQYWKVKRELNDFLN